MNGEGNYKVLTSAECLVF